MSTNQITIVLVRTEGPSNLGSVARLTGNFGSELRLVGVSPSVLTPEAYRMAHPCQSTLDSCARFDDLEAAIADHAIVVGTSGKMEPEAGISTLDFDRASALRPSPPDRIAVVFGNERTGLSRREAAACQRLFRLPNPGPVASLNLASAVAVTLTLFCRPESQPRASTESLRLLSNDWHATMQRTQGRGPSMGRLQELCMKMDLSERDIELVRELLNLSRRS